MIENRAVKGVEIARQPRILPNEKFEDELLEADAVISTLPVWHVLRVVPEWVLPDWYTGQIRHLAQDRFRIAWLGLYLAVDEPAPVLDRRELATWLHAPTSRVPGFLFEMTALDPSTAPEGKYLYVTGGIVPGERGTDERFLLDAFQKFEHDIGTMYPGLANADLAPPAHGLRAVVRGDPEAGPRRHVPAALQGAERRRPLVRERDVPQPRDRRRPRFARRPDGRRGLPGQAPAGPRGVLALLMGELDGRVALVTGAGRGIGKAIAERLAADGAAVVVNDVDEDVARAAAREIPGSVAAVGSVADSAVTDELVATAEREFGGLDLVVNNAGITRDAMLHRMTDAEWDLVVDVSLRGTFNVCRSASRLLRSREAAYNRKVVNMASVNGIYGVAGNVNYSAAKGGVIGLTKALAREWARQRINVNAVAPGYIEGTRLTSARGEGEQLGIPGDVVEKIRALVPIGRPGTPEDVAASVAFLCAPDSDYITGQILEIHGGMEIVQLS